MRDYDRVKDEIRERIAPEELLTQAGRELKKTGPHFTASCIFHDEKEPSMTVYPDHVYCWGCGKYGDIFEIWMAFHGGGYMDALRQLADRTGVTMPAFTPEEQERIQVIRDQREVYGLYMGFARHELGKNVEAQAWLQKRGILPETAKAVGLGFCPDGHRLLGAMRGRKALDEALLGCGIARRRKKDGKVYDGFYGSIVFPWYQRGELVYLTGRRISGEKRYGHVKPEGPKSPACYLPMGTRVGRRVLVCEGETDTLTLLQAGVEGRTVVGLAGAQTGGEDLARMLRNAERIDLLLDADGGGERGLRRLSDHINIGCAHVLTPEYPEGVSDPNDLLQVMHSAVGCSIEEASKGVKKTIEEAIDQAAPFVQWAIDGVDGSGLEKMELVQALRKDVLPLLARMDDLEADVFLPLITGRGKPLTAPSARSEINKIRRASAARTMKSRDGEVAVNGIDWPERIVGGKKAGLPIPHSEPNIRALLDHYKITVRH